VTSTNNPVKKVGIRVCKYDSHIAAHFIAAELIIKRVFISQVARLCDFNQIDFSKYLNRKLNLLPEQIEKVLGILQLKERVLEEAKKQKDKKKG
jgi:hypothetical protein